VRVVVEVGPGTDDPIDEAGFDERHQAGHAEARWREGTGEREADRRFFVAIAFGE